MITLRKYLLPAALAAAMFAFPISASAQPVPFDPRFRLGPSAAQVKLWHDTILWNSTVLWNNTVLWNKQEAATRRYERRATIASRSQPSSLGGDSFLACTRANESDTAGGYSAVDPTGTYYGAYQFDQTTWNSVAPAEWVGKDPAAAPPGVQDQAALTLHAQRGAQPWGGRCG